MKTADTQAKILVIDDDPDFLKLVSLMLESTPYSVITANNPQEGKEKLFAERPDLILLDIMMDTLFDGYSFCHAVKTSPEFNDFKDTPVIFVSAVKDTAGSRFAFPLQEQGLKGPDDYMDKPVEAEELVARIEKLLNR